MQPRTDDLLHSLLLFGRQAANGGVDLGVLLCRKEIARYRKNISVLGRIGNSPAFRKRIEVRVCAPRFGLIEDAGHGTFT